jgi:hypothetical protein
VFVEPTPNPKATQFTRKVLLLYVELTPLLESALFHYAFHPLLGGNLKIHYHDLRLCSNGH